mmetsp:Transcript_3777/g.6629  ORF Transcript_3777/g.6629 Transcript_3777/m.6629 type:complete len:226 (-) Transcript_3777:401-1078(-)
MGNDQSQHQDSARLQVPNEVGCSFPTFPNPEKAPNPDKAKWNTGKRIEENEVGCSFPTFPSPDKSQKYNKKRTEETGCSFVCAPSACQDAGPGSAPEKIKLHQQYETSEKRLMNAILESVEKKISNLQQSGHTHISQENISLLIPRKSIQLLAQIRQLKKNNLSMLAQYEEAEMQRRRRNRNNASEMGADIRSLRKTKKAQAAPPHGGPLNAKDSKNTPGEAATP